MLNVPSSIGCSMGFQPVHLTRRRGLEVHATRYPSIEHIQNEIYCCR